MPDLIKNCTLERDQMQSLADGFDIAAKACSSYAQAIDDAHSKIIHEMLVLGATVAVTEVLAAILIPLSGGISEAVSKVVDVSRLTATGAPNREYYSRIHCSSRAFGIARSQRSRSSSALIDRTWSAPGSPTYDLRGRSGWAWWPSHRRR